MSGRWRIVQSVRPTIHVNPICPYPSLQFEVDTRALLEEVMIDLHVIKNGWVNRYGLGEEAYGLWEWHRGGPRRSCSGDWLGFR